MRSIAISESRPGTCQVSGCDRRTKGRGLCPSHYSKEWQSKGPFTRPSAEESFWSMVDKGDGSGCWIWTGSGARYGHFRRRGAHQVAWEWANGPVPEGLELDHLCRQTYCVRPDHLEPVTHAENMRRGIVGWNSRIKTHCPKGHPYSGDNLLIRNTGGRECRACSRIESRRYNEANRDMRNRKKRALRALARCAA